MKTNSSIKIKYRVPAWDDMFFCAWGDCPRSVTMFLNDIPLCYDHMKRYEEEEQPSTWKPAGTRMRCVVIDPATHQTERVLKGVTVKEAQAQVQVQTFPTPEPESEDASMVEDGLESGKYDEW